MQPLQEAPSLAPPLRLNKALLAALAAATGTRLPAAPVWPHGHWDAAVPGRGAGCGAPGLQLSSLPQHPPHSEVFLLFSLTQSSFFLPRLHPAAL